MNLDSILCENSDCNKWIHRKCAGFSKKELVELEQSLSVYFCPSCKPKILPFNNLSDEELWCSTNDFSDTTYELYKKCSDLDFKQFNCTENKNYFDCDIDPDNEYFNKINIDCKYYTDRHFECITKNETDISIIHFNCRSIRKNFENVKDYLDSLPIEFDIVALTETWESSNVCNDQYVLPGYKSFFISRENKLGGGVAVFTKSNLQVKQINDGSYSVDDIFDCVSIEIENVGKNIVVCCIYRPPNRSINSFSEYVHELLNKFVNKTLYVVGDFNINILNHEKHKETNDFIDLMYSKGVFPLITKPTRITNTTSTLIDNIFTNDLDHKYTSGAFICDVTDHLPIFIIGSNSIKSDMNKSKFIYKRSIDGDNLNSFTSAISNVDWSSIESATDTNKAYDMFINTIVTLYNEHCPLKKVNIKERKVHKPWMSQGFINATKKKRFLYEQSLKLRTESAMNKYKTYKNKLTYILRCEQKRYYCKLIDEHKGNMKKTWQILNRCISKSKQVSCIPKCFKANNLEVSESKDIANGFNNFFVNVGPNLAKSIPDCEGKSFYDYMVNNVQSSVFMQPTCESEINNIIRIFQNKTSSGHDGISMNVVKAIAQYIAKPFSHICNLSLFNGIFPDNMKIAKVVPIFKSGDNQLFTNYRPVSLLPQFSKILEKLFNTRIVSYITKNNI